MIASLLTAPAWSGEVRVGAAAVPITPPDGIPMAGYDPEHGAPGGRPFPDGSPPPLSKTSPDHPNRLSRCARRSDTGAHCGMTSGVLAGGSARMLPCLVGF
jgi:hypothetical protein